MSTWIHFASNTSVEALKIIAEHISQKLYIRVIEIDVRLPLDIKKSKYCCTHTYEDFLSEEELEGIDQRASDIAQNWFYIEGKDVTALSGFSMGKSVELSFFYDLILILKNVAIASKIFKNKTVENIFIGRGVSLKPEAWEKTAILSNAKFRHLSENQESKILIPERFFSFSKRAVKRIKNIFSLSKDVGLTRSEAAFPKKGTIAFIKGRATVSDWLQELGDNEFHLIEIDENSISVDLLLRLKLTIKYYLKWRNDREKISANPIWVYQKINLYTIFAEYIKDLFFKKIPINLSLAIAWNQYLRRNRIEVLIVPWHELSTLQLLSCQSSGVQLLTLQDSWLPGSHFPIGYGRLMRTDLLCTWGKISTSWAQSLPHCNRVIDIGGPKSMEFWKNHTEVYSANRAQTFTVLFTHQCWGAWSAFHSPLDTNDFFEMLAKAAKELQNVQFICKIHPLVEHPLHEGKNRFRIIENQVSNYGLENFSVTPKSLPMHEALKICDVVITYYSLTAVEALVSGKSVIMMNLTRKRDLFPELYSYGVALRATNAEELISSIVSLRTASIHRSRTNTIHILNDIFSPSKSLTDVIRSQC
mgnify:CR=1 FL=1